MTSRKAGLLAKGRSRASLEPTKWSQVQLQGTMLGHFAQTAEYGPGFRPWSESTPKGIENNVSKSIYKLSVQTK
eukprot:777118-Amphidinium_carterae.1